MTEIQAITYIENTFSVSRIYARKVYEQNCTLPNYLDVVAKQISEKPKPFVKWVGGKRQLIKQFREMGLYPPEDFHPIKNTYFEPFVGGGAVFFDLLPHKALLSDMNFELVTTYNVIKNDVEGLIKSLKKHVYSKEYFLQVRSQKVEDLTPLQIASRFIYLNRTCFNGMYRVNSKGEFNVPFGKYDTPLICDEINLRKVSTALKHVEIKHQDYKEVLTKAKKGDFVYFDPPYHPMSSTSSFTAYTKESFGEKEQIELRDTFLKLHKRGCYVMLSNSNADFINQIYNEIKNEGIVVHKVEAGRAINSKAGGRGKIKEILVTNY
jgi:DNA adenine methylase